MYVTVRLEILGHEIEHRTYSDFATVDDYVRGMMESFADISIFVTRHEHERYQGCECPIHESYHVRPLNTYVLTQDGNDVIENQLRWAQ
jgi:hypothetical protein